MEEVVVVVEIAEPLHLHPRHRQLLFVLGELRLEEARVALHL